MSGFGDDKTERLQLLKLRAREMLSQHGKQDQDDHAEVATHSSVNQLLEDLRIYQAELEIQNDELRQAQHDSELAKLHYQMLFDQMPMAALVVDKQGMVQSCNGRANALLGDAPRFGIADNRLIHSLEGADRTRLHVALRDMVPGKSPVLHGLELTDSNDAEVVLDVHLIQLSLAYHLNSHTLVLMVDRSDEVDHENDRHFFSLMLDSSDNFIYATDIHGHMLLANKAMLAFLDRPRDEVIGKRRESFLPLRDALVHNDADHQVISTATAMTLQEEMHMGGSAGALEFLTRKFPLRDLNGRIYGVGAIATDVTELKARQRETQLSEAVFMTAAEAIIVTDAQTCIIRVNPAFTKQSGFSQESVLGHRASILKSGRQSSAFYQQMWATINTQGRWMGEMCNRSADGHYYTVWSNINAVCDAQGKVMYYAAVQSDLTSLREAQAQVEHMATYDSLTGLPNRSLFADRFSQLMATTLRYKRTFALLFIDLDHFKEVNDTLGHSVGDELLVAIARRLRLAVRAEDTVARMGGDEFVVLLPHCDRGMAERFANTLLEKLREVILLGGSVQYVAMASVGVALFPHDGDTQELLLRNADIAMYEAKLSGRNRSTSYVQKMGEEKSAVFAVQMELGNVVAQQQLRVYFQPKFDLKTGLLVGAEALVRWERPGHGLVSPVEFIPIAERTGQLIAIDRWVLEDALRQVSEWTGQGVWKPGWRVSVNHNAADLQRLELITDLKSLLERYQLDATALELEITEDALLVNTQEMMALLRELTEIGVTLAIDDFGTGYSSLSYLRMLPAGVIKIDQSFVRDMFASDNARSLIETIVAMAHGLGHELVAEGIETDAQRARLLELGCEVGQGYWFGKPVSAQEFAQAHLHLPPAPRLL